MQALNVIFIGFMGFAAIYDWKTHRIHILALAFLLALAICKGFMFQDMLQGFGLMVFSMFTGLFILKPEAFKRMLQNQDVREGDEAIGGGDVWLGTFMSCFMGFDKFLIAYTVAALLGSIAMMTIYSKYRTLDVAYAPYLAAGAFWAMFIAR